MPFDLHFHTNTHMLTHTHIFTRAHSCSHKHTLTHRHAHNKHLKAFLFTSAGMDGHIPVNSVPHFIILMVNHKIISIITVITKSTENKESGGPTNVHNEELPLCSWNWFWPLWGKGSQRQCQGSQGARQGSQLQPLVTPKWRPWVEIQVVTWLSERPGMDQAFLTLVWTVLLKSLVEA